MFTQQVADYNQDLGVNITSSMIMNWLLRCEAYAWYFLPPVTSVLILWWYASLQQLHTNMRQFLNLALCAGLACWPCNICIGEPWLGSHASAGPLTVIIWKKRFRDGKLETPFAKYSCG